MGSVKLDNKTFSDFLPLSYKNLPLIEFKHNLFFEEKEEIGEALKNLTVLKGSKVKNLINFFFY